MGTQSSMDDDLVDDIKAKVAKLHSSIVMQLLGEDSFLPNDEVTEKRLLDMAGDAATRAVRTKDTEEQGDLAEHALACMNASKFTRILREAGYLHAPDVSLISKN